MVVSLTIVSLLSVIRRPTHQRKLIASLRGFLTQRWWLAYPQPCNLQPVAQFSFHKGAALRGPVALWPLRAMPQDQGDLSQDEDQCEAENAERLEIDPDVFRLGPPDDFVEAGHGSEEAGEAETQAIPAGFIHLQAAAHDIANQGLLQDQATEQDDRKQALDDGRFHLDESIVVQPQGQPAKR